MKRGDVTVRVVAPHFVAAIDFTDHKVVFAAPILHYMLGWTAARVREYVDQKGWEAKRLPPNPK